MVAKCRTVGEGHKLQTYRDSASAAAGWSTTPTARLVGTMSVGSQRLCATKTGANKSRASVPPHTRPLERDGPFGEGQSPGR